MRFLICVIICSLFFTSCSKQGSEFMVTINLIDEINRKPIPYQTVHVEQITKPWYWTEGSKKILEANTNEIGEFSIRVKKSRSYIVSVYGNQNRKIEITDSPIGGFFLEGKDSYQGQIIEIVCKK